MKRMLINATHTDEIRVAIADGQKLYDLDIDSAGHYRKKGNIYKARITRVEPSLEACFVNYGSERHGFLPYKEISPAYCRQAPKGQPRLPINKALKEGDEIIVQVNKEERGNKGAALSTYISLAGRYLVYMPGNHRAGGISRQIKGDKRAQLQNILSNLEIPKNDGVIVRTAGLGCAPEELEWDFTYLKQVWEAIGTAAENKKAPFFIYQESDLFIRALRDYLQPDIGEILIDDRASYEKAREFMQQVMPHNLKKLSHYNDTTPLFSRYQIERQIQSAFEREVKLPSGGSLVIDHTEALLSIDINSARATKGADVEATATHTNLEAADEIARQLRIRDLGGLVVIDFIDMRNHKNQREVENRMKAAADIDRARVQVGKISKFGLLEMSRQRLRSSINDSSQITCPTCSGHGYIRSMDSLVISVIRLTEEEMIKPKTGKVVIQAPIEVTNKILNEKRTELNEMEKRHKVQVAVISNENLSFPAFHVQRYNVNDANINVANIELVTPEDCHKAATKLDPPAPTQEKAMLQMVKPDVQAPKRSLGLLISSWFKALFSSKKKTKQHNKSRHNKKPYNKKQGHKQGQKQQGHKQGKPHHNKGAKPGQKPKQGKQQPKQQGQKQQPKPQHNKQQPKQQGQKPQHNKQQANQQGQKQQPKPQHNKQQPKQQGQKQQHSKQQHSKQQNNQQADNQNVNSDQNTANNSNANNQSADNQSNGNQNTGNKQQSNRKPRGKSIYGNKNRGNKSSQSQNNKHDNSTENKNNTGNQPQADKQPNVNAQKSPTENQADSNTVANKMTRPLGSVADLAAKKDAVAPTAVKIDNKSEVKKVQSTKEAAQPQDKAFQDKSSQSKAPQKKTQRKQTQKKTDNKPQASEAPKKEGNANNKVSDGNKTEDNKQKAKQSKNQHVGTAPSPSSTANYATEKTTPTNKPGVHKLKSGPKKVETPKVETPKVEKSKAEKPKPAASKQTSHKADAKKAEVNKAETAKQTEAKPAEGSKTAEKKSKPGLHKLSKTTPRKSATPKPVAKKPATADVKTDADKEVKTKTAPKPAAKKKTSKKAAAKKATSKKATTKKRTTKKATPKKATAPKVDVKTADVKKAETKTADPKPAKTSKQPDLFSEAPTKPPKAD